MYATISRKIHHQKIEGTGHSLASEPFSYTLVRRDGYDGSKSSAQTHIQINFWRIPQGVFDDIPRFQKWTAATASVPKQITKFVPLRLQRVIFLQFDQPWNAPDRVLGSSWRDEEQA